jgi:integrase
MPHRFDIEQILRLLQAAKDDNETAWLLMAVAFIHALRAGEAVEIRPSNVVDGKLIMKREKKSNDVCDELLAHHNPLLNERGALIALARQTPEKQRLFPITTRTFQRWVHKYGEAAGLPKLYSHPHTLKHSILTYLRKTMALDELQDRSGHKSLDSLRIYLNPEKVVTDGLVNAAFVAVKG